MRNGQLVAAGFFLRRWQARGWRWLLLKARKHGEWGFPKGHRDPGELLLQTARRECREESGLSVIRPEGRPYRIGYQNEKGRHKLVYYFPGLTAQHRFSLSDEHLAAAWLDAHAVLHRLPHPGLRQLFQRYLNDYHSIARLWPSN